MQKRLAKIVGSTMDFSDQTLPTQAVDAFEVHNDASQKVWGRLVSMNPVELPPVDFEKDEYVMGRSVNCDVHLKNQSLSAQHCRIFRVIDNNYADLDPTVFIEDLSSNGTFLNGTKLGKGVRRVLTHGAKLSLGKNATTFYTYLAVAHTRAPPTEQLAVLQHYAIQDVLGNGNFAVVKKAVKLASGRPYAIKIIDKKKIQLQPALKLAFEREVEILRGLKHPGVVTYEDYYDEQEHIYIVLELATGGELSRLIFAPEPKKLKETDIKFVFFQLCVALKYLHDKSIAHRDLKPENVLVANKESLRVMITDFGLSRMTSQASMMNTVCGTPLYLAPEILNNTDQKGYSCSVDLWSMGVMLYVMLAGHPPFQEESRDALFAKIVTGSFEFKPAEWKKVSVQAIDLIKRMLVTNPAKRYTVDNVLNHPWLQDPDVIVRYDAMCGFLSNDYTCDELIPPQLRSGITNAFGNAGLLDSDLMDTTTKPACSQTSTVVMDVDHPRTDDGGFKIPTAPLRAAPLRPAPMAPTIAPPAAAPPVAAVHVPGPSAAPATPPAESQKSLKRKLSEGTDLASSPAARRVTRGTSTQETISNTNSSNTSSDSLPATTTATVPLTLQHSSSTASSSSSATLSSSSSSLSSPEPAWGKLLPITAVCGPQLLTLDVTVIGRDPGCQIVVNAPMVSSSHCTIRRLPDGTVELEDTSRNGTMVNEVPIKKKVVLKQMDEIILGREKPTPNKSVVGFCFKLIK